ncbi:hypothetical protein [Arthrobacter sp. D3-16]
MFTFLSLAAYEQYRRLFGVDPDFIASLTLPGVSRYDRTFMRPLLPDDLHPAGTH